jgi:alkylhydroperoxidase/carboxymuconolactone decarboxylase family protein YurZ
MPKPPKRVIDFEGQHPDIWKAFTDLAQKCHESGGPLDDRSRRLVKLGIAIGMQHEGALHSATRHALEAGLSPEEIFHAGILGITTLGWPSAYAALTWINDTVSAVRKT